VLALQVVEQSRAEGVLRRIDHRTILPMPPIEAQSFYRHP